MKTRAGTSGNMGTIHGDLAAVGVGGFFIWRKVQERKAQTLRLAGSRRLREPQVQMATVKPTQSAVRFASVAVNNPRTGEEVLVSIV